MIYLFLLFREINKILQEEQALNTKKLKQDATERF